MKTSFSGFYRRTETHGPISGTGPGFDKAMQQFRRRQEQAARVGKWRAVDAAWTRDDGEYIDPDYYIVDNMGNHIYGDESDASSANNGE